MATHTHLVKQEEGQTEHGAQVRTGDPGSPVANQIWINTTTGTLNYYDTSTHSIGGANSDTTLGMTSNNASSGSKTVAANTSLFVPFLSIGSGHVYTVSSSAQLVSVSTITVTGTLTVSGTVVIL